jgi:hypothetical protein
VVVSGDGEGILQLQEVYEVPFCGSVGVGARWAGVAVASRGRRRWRLQSLRAVAVFGGGGRHPVTGKHKGG